MNELSLFTGAGGGVLGSKLLGWKTIGYCEINESCQKIIAQRVEDGHLDRAPIFGDIRGFIKSGAAREYRGFADVVTAGFPCQPFSVAGRQDGEFDPRNMWPQTIEVIRQVRPRFALLENVPGLLAHAYFGTILGDLAESGYDAVWDCFSAASVGAPHERERLWILAYPIQEGLSVPRNLRGIRQKEEGRPSASAKRGSGPQWPSTRTLPQETWEPPRTFESRMGRGDHGIPNRVDRVEAIGDAQVPAVVVRAWETLSQCL